MKRITFWLLSTFTVVVLLFGYDGSHASTDVAAAPPAAVSKASSASGSATSGAGSTRTRPTQKKTKASSSSSAKASTVTGDVVSTQWGPVQVQLTISNGTITGVTLLQQPSGNPQDDQINAYAVPILTRETLDAQSASIDMVSGATVTSTGYLQSLQSAIDRAGG